MTANVPEIKNKTALIQWCQNHGIDLCMLFGSYSTGMVHPQSDVDLAIYSKAGNLIEKKLTLIGELEDMLQKTVDLTIFHSDMSPLLLYEIML
jgi:predicted nucleotidyltransferase